MLNFSLLILLSTITFFVFFVSLGKHNLALTEAAEP